jgi:hypothetical protein
MPQQHPAAAIAAAVCNRCCCWCWCCREAGSTELDLEVLMATCLALKQAAEFSNEADNYLPLADAVHQVRRWLAGKQLAGQQLAGQQLAGQQLA